MKMLMGGVVLGVLIVLAGFGAKSLLQDSNPQPVQTSQEVDRSSDTEVTERKLAASQQNTPAQETAIASDATVSSSVQTMNRQPLDVDGSDISRVPGSNDQGDAQVSAQEGKIPQVSVDGEQQKNSAVLNTPSGGSARLTLSSQNLKEPGKPVMATYQVMNERYRMVAEETTEGEVNFNLPEGVYTALIIVGDFKSSRLVELKDGKLTEEVFSVSLPDMPAAGVATNTGTMQQNNQPDTQQTSVTESAETSTDSQTMTVQTKPGQGVVLLSALSAKNQQPLRVNFYVQDHAGKHINNSTYVSRSQFDLPVGTYRITVKSGKESMVRQVDVTEGKQISEVFEFGSTIASSTIATKSVAEKGLLELTILQGNSTQKQRANITLQDEKGKTIEQMRQVSGVKRELPVGKYRVVIQTATGTETRDLLIKAGLSLNEVIRFKLQGNDNVAANVISKSVIRQQGGLEVSALDGRTNKPIKANFYVQSLKGEQVDNKTYMEKARFQLKPGSYKLVVRAHGMKDSVQTVTVGAGKLTRESVRMSGVNTQGQLKVVLEPTQGQKRRNLTPKFNIAIKRTDGKVVLQQKNIAVFSSNLAAGDYIVTVMRNGISQHRRVTVKQAKVAITNFKAADFGKQMTAAITGVLQVNALDGQNGTPLKASYTIVNRHGQVVASVQDVPHAEFRLPPQEYIIHIQFKDLKGTRPATVRANDTTVSSFNIVPKANSTQQKQTVDPRDVIEQKLKEELFRLIR